MKNAYFILLSLICISATSSEKQIIEWQNLETGLDYTSMEAPVKSICADSRIDVLKINPKYFAFELQCMEQKKTGNKKIDQICKENNLIAAVNAGMFKLEGNFQTGTGYMKNGSYINNPSLNSSYKTAFAFNSKDTSKPKATLIDLTCEDWAAAKSNYTSFSQGIRMVNCEGKATWQASEKKWSMVLLGEDVSGNILFIFCRSPYKVLDYTNMLLHSDLHIKRLMYLEGGPEASFYLNHPKKMVQKMGSYETGFNENDNNTVYWEIPNVIGIKRK
ncbi:phosphodiester glycosidase family protein [Cytophaga aurantiaca]|uniref:phosphodiester glycosidase family protein n=1 Tax=Cytophaga aurantiaca TaxID=29530 RepID=UPI0003689F51|nr:phosphodiester glycosidase family protein [Cytophaga aurantiaca]